MEDWTEKYRPNTVDDIVGNEKALIELRKWAKEWNEGKPRYKAIVLSGKAGIGKTSCAIALAKDFGWTTIELNTSDVRNAKKIKSVATSGAVNETFSDDGSFISSNRGGRKLIILDEADNLYERIQGQTNNKDLSDRGGKKAIVDTVKITNQPIILIVNDYYGLIKGSGEDLKKYCKLIKFYNPFPNLIFNLLKKICLSEGIHVDLNVLQSISDRCKGDIRSAVNDLQSICTDKKQIDTKSLNVLGYRDREKDIFSSLREIFKTKDVKNIKETLRNLDLDPGLVLLWINENLPKEYIDINDLVKGYDMISKSDMFLGRTYKNQNYGLWSYACDLMNGGVAVAKSHNYPNKTYNFPTYIRQIKNSKNKTDIRKMIVKKISKNCHNSTDKTKDQSLLYFTHIFRSNLSFAIKMKNKLDLTEPEIKYLLGKRHLNKLNEILKSSEQDKIKPIGDEIDETKKTQKENNEKIQQSLFDF